MYASFHSLEMLSSRRDILNNTVEDGVMKKKLIELLEQPEKCPK